MNSTARLIFRRDVTGAYIAHSDVHEYRAEIRRAGSQWRLTVTTFGRGLHAEYHATLGGAREQAGYILDNLATA